MELLRPPNGADLRASFRKKHTGGYLRNTKGKGPGACPVLFLFLRRARMASERTKKLMAIIYTFCLNTVRLGATIAALFSLYLGG